MCRYEGETGMYVGLSKTVVKMSLIVCLIIQLLIIFVPLNLSLICSWQVMECFNMMMLIEMKKKVNTMTHYISTADMLIRDCWTKPNVDSHKIFDEVSRKWRMTLRLASNNQLLLSHYRMRILTSQQKQTHDYTNDNNNQSVVLTTEGVINSHFVKTF